MDKCWLVCTRCMSSRPMELTGKCECGGTLLVRYDMEKVAQTFHKNALERRAPGMWRYFELLPVKRRTSIVSLGEGGTPLIRLEAAEKRLPLGQLWIKREEQNPTGSFKARGFSVAVSLLKERGITKATVPSNGNAASALAAYAGRAGMQAYVFIPKDCPGNIVEECLQYGAETVLVDGYIHDAGRIIEDGKAEQGWVNVGTLKEPGRIEGKKTMGLELAEQLGWTLPDVIIYPTGGGSGLIGIWKAFQELKELGMTDGPMPRLVSVQEKGCHPIVDALRSGLPVAPQAGPVHTTPTGLRVPNPPDGNLIVSVLKASGGTAVAVDAEQIRAAQSELGKQGVSSSPEGAATWAALRQLCDARWIGSNERVVLFNTSHAMKYGTAPDASGLIPVRSYRQWVEAGGPGAVRGGRNG